MASGNVIKRIREVQSGINGIRLVQCENIVFLYASDVHATSGAIGTISLRPRAIVSLPCYPQNVSFNCRLRIGTDGAVTVVPTNPSDTLPTTLNNVMANGWYDV